MTHNLAQTLYTLDKKTLKLQILRFLSVLMKFTKFLMSFMKPQFFFFSKFTSIFSIMRHSSSVLFSPNIKYFGQKEPIKVQILRLWSVESEFAKFLISFFKAQVSSSSNLVSFFSVMTHNSSVLFWLKYNILSPKVAHQSPNFQTCHCSH